MRPIDKICQIAAQSLPLARAAIRTHGAMVDAPPAALVAWAIVASGPLPGVAETYAVNVGVTTRAAALAALPLLAQLAEPRADEFLFVAHGLGETHAMLCSVAGATAELPVLS